ncbi:30S ribosomal protein S9 [Candidatus Malacoplasma girerdii]|uniref:Small ribosomal subunit protein uS9 n=1 Tax=Candidatus Malacoplasma girerdii TaxID=1318617 RepID=A0A097STJ1_9BACT|nr:30S ribosomal protein S9 [Candidatus Malacoplasma girerdii]ASJ89419.1 MAG: 30S ribosomal protein S9 [Candidatus Malacoplasma girerdii]
MANTVASYKGLGRRKTSIARVLMTPGTGKITVNKRELNEYFPSVFLIQNLQQPLVLTENTSKFDIAIKVIGGGFQGQSGAIRLGIARALVSFDENLKPILKKAKMLTRDSRKKERKKFGKYGARRSPQFTKR